MTTRRVDDPDEAVAEPARLPFLDRFIVATRLRPLDVEVLGWWLLTRLGVFVISMSAPWLFAGDGAPAAWLDRWRQWDVVHFESIAIKGYFGGAPQLEAFFPGLPMVLRAGHAIGLPTMLVGLLVSLIAGGVAAVALARLADSEFGGGAGRMAALAWMIAPPAVFLAAPYTEALFLGFAIPAWLCARQGRWLSAALLAAGASTVRVSGIFLIIALGVEFLTSGRRRSWFQVLWLAIPTIPVLAYMLYLKSATGDWLAWYNAQAKGWYRGFTNPIDSFINTWNVAIGKTVFDVPGSVQANFEWMYRAELVAMLVGVVLTIALLSYRRWGEATWVGIQVVAFATSYWFFSVPRALLIWFPLWLLLAAIATRRKWVWRAYLVISLPLCGVWAAAYLVGKWSG